MSSFSRAAVWSTLNAAAGVLLPTLVFAFFAHIVPAAEIGLVAVGLAWVEMIKVLSPQGYYEQLISHNSDRDTHGAVGAVLLMSAFVALCIYIVVIWLSGLWRPEGVRFLVALIFLGARLVFDIIILQPQAMLVQQLKFSRIAMRVVWANLGAGVAGILIALHDPLVGLITFYVMQSAFTFILTAVGSNALAQPRWRPLLLRPLARNAGYASGVRIVAASNNYLDQILLSTLMPIAKLAQYNLAKRVETTLITGSASFQGVLYQPLFASGAVEDRAVLVERCIGTLNFLFGVPVLIFAINNALLVRVVFGRQWAAAAPLAAVLAVSGLVRAYGIIHGALLSVSRRNRAHLILTSVSGFSGIAVVLICSHWGLMAVGGALLLRNFSISLWAAWLTRTDMPRPFQTYIKDCILPLGVIAGLGWLAGQGAMRAVNPSSPLAPWAALFASSVIVGGAALWSFRTELQEIIVKSLSRRRYGLVPPKPAA